MLSRGSGKRSTMQDWKLTRKKVMIYGPDISMSASMTGYFVQDDTGKFFHTADVIQPETQPEELSLPEVNLGEMREPGKSMRIHGKSTVMGSLQVPTEGSRTKAHPWTSSLDGRAGPSRHYDDNFTEPSMEEEQTGADRFVRSLLMDVEGLAGGLMEEEKAQASLEAEKLMKEAEDQGVFLQTWTTSWPLESRKFWTASAPEWLRSGKSELRSGSKMEVHL